jgi:tRNA pseudouridine55 synthase
LKISKIKRNKRNISGWLILNKPYDVGSTQAVGKLRWLLEAKKAGHAGTLDPLATGVLPIAFGEATKTIPYIQDSVKIYHFTLVWGVATNTDDVEGEVIATSDIRPARDQVEAVLENFRGVITQVPPAFSAIKINGERAYDLARAGEKFEMPSRQVEIESFILLEHDENQSKFEVICSKGTYIRALARDLALSLGTKGHVGALHRASVGHFNDIDAVDYEEFEKIDLEQREKMLRPISDGLRGMVEIHLDAAQAVTIRLGNPVLLTGVGAPIAIDEAWASHKGEAVAIGYVEKGQFKPKRVILSI